MIGFLGVWEDLQTGPGGSARGALLITDKRGNPLEFAVATPVRPNRLQCAIWGERLRPHAVGHLIATPLLNHIKKDARVVMTNHLDALEAWSDCPLAHLRKGTEPPQPEFAHLADAGGRRGLVLTIAPPEGHARLTQAAEVLSELDPRFEPVGAFDRIHLALIELANIDERYA